MATYWSDMYKSRTAVYRVFAQKDGALLYVGMTKNPLGRISRHRCATPWWRPETGAVELTWFADRTSALDAEREAIRSERPRYNITHNDGAA